MTATFSTATLANTIKGETLDYLMLENKLAKFSNQKYQGAFDGNSNSIRVPVQQKISKNTKDFADRSITFETKTYTDTYDTITVDKLENGSVSVNSIDSYLNPYNDRSVIVNAVGDVMKTAHEHHLAQIIMDGTPAANQVGKTAAIALGSTVPTNLQTGIRRSGRRSAYKPVVFLDPSVIDTMNTELNTGADEAYMALLAGVLSTDKRQFSPKGEEFYKDLVGQFNGALVYEHKGLPGRVKITMGTLPSNGQLYTISLTDDRTQSLTTTAITVTGVTGTPAAGEFKIVTGDLAATQANVVNLINGTGTASATTYADFSAADRALLSHAGVKISSFSSNVAYLTNGYVTDLVSVTTDITNAVIGSIAVVNLIYEPMKLNFVEEITDLNIKSPTQGSDKSAFVNYQSFFKGHIATVNTPCFATFDTVYAA